MPQPAGGGVGGVRVSGGKGNKKKRRVSGQKARWEILMESGGKCSICGTPISESFHIDHKFPYSLGGETVRENLQATCIKCNLKKGARVMGDVNFDSIVLNGRTHRVPSLDSYLPRMRSGQQKAIAKVLEIATSTSRNCASIVCPTRYGKSEIIRSLSVEAKRSNLFSGALAVSPNLYLSKQLCSDHKVEGMARRIGVHDAKSFCKAFTILDNKNIRSTTSLADNFMLSGTAALVQSRLNSDPCKDGINPFRKWIGDKRVIVFVDEAHEVGSQKARGEMIRALMGMGCFVVLLTATPYRADNDRIEGFRYERVNSDEIYKYESEYIDDESPTRRIKEYSAQRDFYKVRADVEITFRDAWESAGETILCKLNRQWIDVSVCADDGSPAGKLHELRDSKTGRPLGKARKALSRVFSEKANRAEALRIGARAFVQDILERRRSSADGAFSNAAGIVFGGNNEEGMEDNYKLEEIKDACAKEWSRLTGQQPEIAIITTDGDEPSENLRLFSEEGNFDIIIVKQMAGAGLDAPRLKTVLDFSPIRTFASCIQRWMRCATPWHSPKGESMLTGTVIIIHDPIADDIYTKGIREEGGEGDYNSKTVGDFELSREWETDDPPEPPHLSGVDVDGFDLGSAGDHQGAEVEMNSESGMMAAHLMRDMPKLHKDVTLAELAESISGYRSGTPAGDTSANKGKEKSKKTKTKPRGNSAVNDREALQDLVWTKIREKCRKVARIPESERSSPMARDAYKKYQNPIKQIAIARANNHIKPGTAADISMKIREITNEPLLKAMAVVIDSISVAEVINRFNSTRTIREME